MTSQSAFAELCAVVEAEVLRSRIPGYAVGLLVNGEEFTAGSGVTNLDHPLPVDGDTLVQIGSITMHAKGIGEVGTAAAIANGVHHATGVRVRDLAVTLDKLLG